MSNYHGLIINLPCRGTLTAYKEGHRDARHAAAEVAWKADAEIDALAARLAEVEAKLSKYENSPEQKARDQMILDVIRAKRDAGFDREVAFFRDVWPLALAALKAQRAADSA